jgi:hypothetical protein
MFLGRQVDDAISTYYQHILEHGEHLTLDQVKDAYWDGWKAAAEAERERVGIAWEAELREERAFKVGLDAIELSFVELIPQLGEPVAVQRRVEYTLAPGLEWLSRGHDEVSLTSSVSRFGRRRRRYLTCVVVVVRVAAEPGSRPKIELALTAPFRSNRPPGAHRAPQGFLPASHSCRKVRFAGSDRPRG